MPLSDGDIVTVKVEAMLLDNVDDGHIRLMIGDKHLTLPVSCIISNPLEPSDRVWHRLRECYGTVSSTYSNRAIVDWDQGGTSNVPVSNLERSC